MTNPKNSQQDLQGTLEATNLCLWEWDMLRGKIRLSPPCDQLFGMEPGECPKTCEAFSRYVHPEDLDGLKLFLYESQKRHKKWEKSYRMIQGNGSISWVKSKGTFFYDDSGEAVKMIAFSQKLSPFKQLEAQGVDSNQLFEKMFKTSEQMFALLSLEGNILEVNQIMLNWGRFSYEEVINRPFWQIPAWVSLPETQSLVQAAIAMAVTGESLRCEINGVTKNNQQVIIEIQLKPILNQTGEVTLIMAEGRDITDIKQKEVSPLAVSQGLQSLLSASPTIIFSCKPDKDYTTTYISDNIENILGYKAQEIIENPSFWLNHVHSDDLAKLLEGVNQFLGQKVPNYRQEYRFLHAHGHYCWLSEELRLLTDEKGEPREILGFLMDISEQQELRAQKEELEKQLKQVLQAKQILLREMHHRLKNNLHVIINLLDLQADYLEDPTIIQLFVDTQNRLQSMAFIYEQLQPIYQHNLVNFQAYIQQLLENIFSYNDLDKNIEPVLRVEPLWLNIETAIPCSLLINELLNNSLKHAFFKRKEGKIFLEMTAPNQGFYCLKIADDGVGLPANLNWENSHNFGLKLVRILVKQLKAEVKVDLDCGTAFTLTFKQLNYQPQF